MVTSLAGSRFLYPARQYRLMIMTRVMATEHLRLRPVIEEGSAAGLTCLDSGMIAVAKTFIQILI